MAEIRFPQKSPEKLAEITAWWTVFGEKEAGLCAAFSGIAPLDMDIADFMHVHLNKVHERICWEFGPGLKKPHRLVIAAEANHEIEPLVKLIVAMAPEFEHFDIVLNRPETPWEEFTQSGDTRYSWETPEGIMFTFEHGSFNLIDIKFYVPETVVDKQLDQNCFLMAESLIGEDIFQTWVGMIETQVLPKKKRLFSKPVNVPDETLPISELRTQVIEKITDIRNSLPDAPYSKLGDENEWSIVEINGPEKETYSRMEDVFLATLMDPKLFEAQFQPMSRFSSKRFSKHGEDFIFVKIDAADNDLDLTVVANRHEIQDALSTALKTKNLGGETGGATGRKHAYIMLAVQNLDSALDVVIDTLRSRKMAPKTWILFSDVDRQMEWVGIWDDSPAPVLPDFGPAFFQ